MAFEKSLLLPNQLSQSEWVQTISALRNCPVWDSHVFRVCFRVEQVNNPTEISPHLVPWNLLSPHRSGLTLDFFFWLILSPRKMNQQRKRRPSSPPPNNVFRKAKMGRAYPRRDKFSLPRLSGEWISKPFSKRCPAVFCGKVNTVPQGILPQSGKIGQIGHRLWCQISPSITYDGDCFLSLL